MEEVISKLNELFTEKSSSELNDVIQLAQTVKIPNDLNMLLLRYNRLRHDIIRELKSYE